MTQTITRETILRILQTIEPYVTLSQPNMLSLVNEAAQYDHNCTDLREIWEQLNVSQEKRGAYALLTLVAEDLLNGAAALAEAEKSELRGYTTSASSNSSSQTYNGAVAEVSDGPTTLHFIYVERGESKGSASPKWEFRTATGERYWAFEHKDEKRNTIPLFTLSGYHELRDMQIGASLRWNKHPITVACIKDGDFWKAQTVTMKPVDAHPDSSLLDCITSAKKRAALKDMADIAAGTEYDGRQIVIIDSETTGTSDQDELVEFAGFNLATGEVFETLISTDDNARINALTHINGITEEMLDTAPSFAMDDIPF